MENVSTNAYLWRTVYTDSRSFGTHDYSKKNGKNILMAGYAMTICILIKSSCAYVLMHVIMVKKIHVWDGFFYYFSCYNRMQYRWRWKASIINAFFIQHHDSLKIGLNDTISVLEEVYVVYLVKTDARVTKSDIHKVTKRCYCTTKISINLQCNYQWQRCKDK